MIISRYIKPNIVTDLKTKMIFIGGPRQVGKTTLAKYIGGQNFKHPVYLNWDNSEDRKTINTISFPSEADLIIFDELHKYAKWKTYIKGIFDKHKEKFSIIVTGSSRLNIYKHSGDSLLGRYHYYCLHPFSLREVLGQPCNPAVKGGLDFLSGPEAAENFNLLMEFGGFPDPFLSRDKTVLRRFQNQRADRLIKEDIRDIEAIRDLSALQILAEILPSKVGSLLSTQSLAQDLQSTHKTVAHWLDVLENFYFHFRIYPFQSTIIKSLRKQPKSYLWDWSILEDRSARLENIVASHLLKYANFLYDALGYKAEVFFLRDTDGKEADFIFAINKKPWFIVEVKFADADVSPALKYFSRAFPQALSFQVIGTPGVDFTKDGVRVISADKFLSAL